MNAKGTTISMYFGEKHTDTLKRLDAIAEQYRLSRTQVVEFLLRQYELANKSNKITPEESTSKAWWEELPAPEDTVKEVNGFDGRWVLTQPTPGVFKTFFAGEKIQ